MLLTSGLRKFTLTAHLASSLGWLGADAGFLALAVLGLVSQNPQNVRSALYRDERDWLVCNFADELRWPANFPNLFRELRT